MRGWLLAMSAALCAAASGAEDTEPTRNAATRPGRAAKPPAAEIIETKVICKQKGRYIGWPTICRRSGGELLVVFSGDRDAHVCPFGKTQMVRSGDGGKTWSPPATINNTPLDDRDAGVIETRRGTLIVSWFTSLAFERDVRPHWRRHVEKIGPETKQRWLGSWLRRSTDGGRTWGEPIRVTGSAPHGPIELSDGRLLYVGNRFLDGRDDANVAEVSGDDGRTWKLLATVPAPKAPRGLRLCEPHVVEAATGRLVAMFRAEGVSPGEQFLYQSDSGDGGRSWTVPRRTKIWGYPPHLLRLSDGRLVVTYGRRKRPYGERACLSRDGGRTWDTAGEIALASAPNGDLGYPAGVELPDGTILTVYYQVHRPGEKTSLLATRWRPPGR